jgi:tryptophan synthase alpha subunit
MSGRIEEAFKAAREKGEAAFITFVTAGYPAAKGKSERLSRGLLLEIQVA